MAAPTQDAVISLILNYIGGSRLHPSNKLDVLGQKVPVQSTPLTAIAAQLKQYGTTSDQIKQKILVNPKANVTTTAKANVQQLKDRINNL
jgi:hypothetical protein